MVSGLELACWGNNMDLDRALSDDSYIPWVQENFIFEVSRQRDALGTESGKGVL